MVRPAHHERVSLSTLCASALSACTAKLRLESALSQSRRAGLACLVVLGVTATALWPRPDPLTRPLRFSTLELGPRELSRGQPTERVEPMGDGFELSWRFEHEPRGEGPLRLRFSTSVTPAAREAFGWQLGVALLGPSTWVDAAGRRSALETRAVGDALEIEVPEAVLRQTSWPAVLDPLLLPSFFIDSPVVGPVARTPVYVVAGGPRAMGVLGRAANLECRLWELDGGFVSSSVLPYDGGGYPLSLTNSGDQYLLELAEGPGVSIRRISETCGWLGAPQRVAQPTATNAVAATDGGWWVVSSLVPGDAGPFIAYQFLDQGGTVTTTGSLGRADPVVRATAVGDTLFVASAGRPGASPVVTVDCLSSTFGNQQMALNRNLNYGLVALASNRAGVAGVLVGDSRGNYVRLLTSDCSTVTTSAGSPDFYSLFSAGIGFGLASPRYNGTFVRSLDNAGNLGTDLQLDTAAYTVDVVWSGTPLLFDNLTGGDSSMRWLSTGFDAVGPRESLTIGVNRQVYESSAWGNGRGWLVWQDDRRPSSSWVRAFDSAGPVGQALPLVGANVNGECIAALGPNAVVATGYFGHVRVTSLGDGGLQSSGLIASASMRWCEALSGAQTAWFISYDYDFGLGRYKLIVHRFHLDGGVDSPIDLIGPRSYVTFAGFSATSTADGERVWVAATPFVGFDPDGGRLFELSADSPTPQVSVMDVATVEVDRTTSALCARALVSGGSQLRCTFDDGGIQRDTFIAHQGSMTMWADDELLHLRVQLSDGGFLWGASSADGGVRLTPQGPFTLTSVHEVLRSGVETFWVVGSVTIDGGEQPITRVTLTPMLHLEDGKTCGSGLACISGYCGAGVCGEPLDAGPDAGGADAGFDGGSAGVDPDAGLVDAGVEPDAGLVDAGEVDAGPDAGTQADGGAPDGGSATGGDAGAEPPDAGQGFKPYAVGCSCASVDGLSGLMVGLFTLMRVRRRSR